MPHEIRIYFEGDKSLRVGFAEFFSKIRRCTEQKRCKFHLIATNGTPERDFGIAIKSHPNSWNILLLDCEGPRRSHASVALCRKNHWHNSHANSIFWMIEMMESWFHADKDELEKYYGHGFKRKALKANPNVEQIPKCDLEDGLKAATRSTAKGNYYDNKTRHGAELLARIKPALVRKAAPNCEALFVAVFSQLGCVD